MLGLKRFLSDFCSQTAHHLPSRLIDANTLTVILQKYILSKLQSEQELLSYNDGERPAFEVVTLALGVVAGDTVLGLAPQTLEFTVSPVSGMEFFFGFLRLMQRLLGSVPLVHVDDVCDALVFCMERSSGSVAGRFLCAAAYPTIHDVVDHYVKKFPRHDVLKEYVSLHLITCMYVNITNIFLTKKSRNEQDEQFVPLILC
jgi:nucleoside-diphosphate-sugar epimerase